MKLRTLLLTAALAFMGNNAAHAESAMSFYNACGSSFMAGFANRGYCHGYIVGLAQGLVIGRIGNAPRACYSQGVNDQQLVLVVQQYMKAHPAKLNEPVAKLITEALADAFPC
jgi:hypothetical protein